MRKPVVDYSTFRFSKLNEPQFKHLLFLLGWIGYFALYFLTERFIDPAKCYTVHSPLDDIIPFCEWFILPYVGWYLLIVGSLLYLMFYNPDNFTPRPKIWKPTVWPWSPRRPAWSWSGTVPPSPTSPVTS